MLMATYRHTQTRELPVDEEDMDEEKVSLLEVGLRPAGGAG